MVGISDGGNEIGMGVIRKEVEEILVHGTGSSVPGGFAPSVRTDTLLVAAVSNWGATALRRVWLCCCTTEVSFTMKV